MIFRKNILLGVFINILVFVSTQVIAENITAIDNYSEMHENKLIFKKDSGTRDLYITSEEVKVTSGQQHNDEISFDWSPTEYYISFFSGRKKSEEVANYFMLNTGSLNDHVLGFFADRPAALNFAIKTKFIINGSPVTSNVYLAQGSNGIATNDWWIGCMTCNKKDRLHLILETEDGLKYDVEAIKGFRWGLFTYHTFNISKISS